MPRQQTDHADVTGGDAAFFRFERADCDFPFYRGTPVRIGVAGWVIVLISVAVAFAALLTMQPFFTRGFSAFIPAILFVSIPLGTLAAVGGTHAPLALFRSMRGADWPLIVGVFLLNAVVTIAVGYLIIGLFHTAANPAADRIAEAAGLDQALFFLWIAVQILGEELLTILPFLAFLTLFYRVLPRKPALVLAALGASAIFALVHLPTYQWNAAQALVGLVPVRMILLVPFIITRNIWTSTGAHVLNDWAIFGFGLLVGSDAAG